MSSDTIFYAILSTGVASGWFVLFYALKTLQERSEKLTNVLVTAVQQQTDIESSKELTDMVVKLHREVKTLETSVEQYQLQVVEMRNIVKRQTARWNMQRRRETEEGEEEPLDDRTAGEQLVADLGFGDVQEEAQSPPVRRRRRRASRRRPY